MAVAVAHKPTRSVGAWFAIVFALATAPTAYAQQAGFGYITVGAGAARISPDTLDNELSVSSSNSAGFQIGLGYRFNSMFALEARAADIGSAQFEDDRELGYQFVDATALWSYSFSRLAVFARAGLGTFRNDGDFNVELNHPAHAVAGFGAYIQATRSLDVRLSVSAHDEDAIFGSLDLVWAFQKLSSPNVLTQTDVDSEEPVDTQTATVESTALTTSTSATSSVDTSPNPAPADLPVVIRSTTPAPAAQSGLVIEPVPEPLPEAIASVNPLSLLSQQATDEPSLSNQNGTVSRPFTARELPQVELIRGAEVGKPDAGRLPSTSSTSTPNATAATSNDGDAEAITSNEVNVVSRFSNVQPGDLLPIGPILFSQSDALLTAESTQQIQQLITALDENTELSITVEAHASPVGNSELNMLLSRRRALTVVRALVDGGVQATRLRPMAFGDAVPVSANTSDGRNDRVELRVR